MSEDLSAYDCLIAIVGEETEDPDLDRYRAMLVSLEDKWIESFTCSFPVKTALKNIRFEHREKYTDAIKRAIAYVEGKIMELQDVIYVRVQSERSCVKPCTSKCACPPKCY